MDGRPAQRGHGHPAGPRAGRRAPGERARRRHARRSSSQSELRDALTMSGDGRGPRWDRSETVQVRAPASRETGHRPRTRSSSPAASRWFADRRHPRVPRPAARICRPASAPAASGPAASAARQPTTSAPRSCDCLNEQARLGAVEASPLAVQARGYGPAMTRTLVRYRCRAAATSRRSGSAAAPECGEWGSLREAPVGGRAGRSRPGASLSRPVAARRGRRRSARRAGPPGVPELDRVLGGGLVAGLGHADRRRARAWARARCCCRRSARWPPTAPAACSCAPRSRPRRCGCAPTGSARSRPSCSSSRETSLPAMRRARRRRSRPTCSRSTRSRPCTIPTRRARPGSVAQVRDGAQRLVRLAKEHGHRDAARRARHQGRLARRARARSSTSSTPCCRSKATATTRCACCAR